MYSVDTVENIIRRKGRSVVWTSEISRYLISLSREVESFNKVVSEWAGKRRNLEISGRDSRRQVPVGWRNSRWMRSRQLGEWNSNSRPWARVVSPTLPRGNETRASDPFQSLVRQLALRWRNAEDSRYAVVQRVFVASSFR